MAYALLSGRGLISVSGDERVSFLQGLVSNDVAKLKTGEARYAALLTPQGKFLHDFFLIATDDAILIEMEKDRMRDLMQRLAMYKLRSKVAIEVQEHKEVAAMWGETPSASAEILAFTDPRLPELGFRLVGEKAKLESLGAPQNEDAYEAHRINLGVPGSKDMIIDKSLLLEFGFDELHGVDFNKGCYVGQEVTARSKFRGQLKKGIYKIEAAAGPVPQAGTAITLGGIAIGELRSHSGKAALAILRHEDVERAMQEGIPLLAGDISLNALQPAWINKA